MRAQLKFIRSADVDIETFVPIEREVFGFWATAAIGPSDRSSSDQFEVLICSPAWLHQQMDAGDLPSVWFARGVVLMREYDFAEVKRLLSRSLDHCNGESWPEVAAKVSRFAIWEFENYQDAGFQPRS